MSQIKGFPEIQASTNVVPIRRNRSAEIEPIPEILADDLEIVAQRVLADLNDGVTVRDHFNAFLAPSLLEPGSLNADTVRGRLAEIVHVLEGEDRRDATARVAKAVLKADLMRLNFLKHQKDAFIEV